MPRTRGPHPEEFRRQMVELVRTGRTPEELSREFEPCGRRSETGSSRPISMRAVATTV